MCITDWRLNHIGCQSEILISFCSQWSPGCRFKLFVLCLFIYLADEHCFLKAHLFGFDVNLLRPSDVYMCYQTSAIIDSDNGLSPVWRQAII